MGPKVRLQNLKFSCNSNFTKSLTEVLLYQDDLWSSAQKELYDWLNSTDGDKGVALFRLITDKLVDVVNADLLARYSVAGSAVIAAASPPTADAPSTATKEVHLSLKVNREPDYKAMYEETRRKVDMLKSASAIPQSNIDYKDLYEKTRGKIDQLKPLVNNSEKPPDYKVMYEETLKQIEEVKASKVSIAASREAPKGILHSLIDNKVVQAILGVRNKILGPGQQMIYPSVEVPTESHSAPASIPIVATSSRVVTAPDEVKADTFEELNFDLRPFDAVSPYQLGTVLYTKQHGGNSRQRRLRRLLEVFQPLYVYVSSDNSVVKEAFCKYLYDRALTFNIKDENGKELHFRLQMMRVVNEGNYIAHGESYYISHEV